MSITGEDKAFLNDPELVQIRAPNSGTLYLDSRQSRKSFRGGKCNECVLGLPSDQSGFRGDDIDARNIKRIGVKEMNINWVIPNVNTSNNTITFYSDQSLAKHTVTIPVGFYSSRVLLMDDIVTALNTVTPQSGITFSRTFNPNTQLFTLDAAGGEYYLDPNCTAVAVQLFYTRYVDVISPQIGAYTRNPNRSNNRTANNIVYRLYLEEVISGAGTLIEGTFPLTLKRINNHITYYNFERSQDVQYLQFELRDEFGNLIAVPDGATGTDSG